eukprot:CFRG3974T1
MPGDRAFYKDLHSLRNERLSLYNRTRSITIDSEFLTEVRESFPKLPFVANLRCGLWYSPKFDDTAYFKSTDGHTHKCDLNLRRLNLHLLHHLQLSGGFILVDSSRRKRFPDSMSRTIPIWAACLNAAVDRYNHRQSNGDAECVGVKLAHSQHTVNNAQSTLTPMPTLHTLPSLVSAMEKDQLEGFIEGWVTRLESTLTDRTLKIIAEQMGDKRLRPIWVSAKSTLPSSYPLADELGFWPVVLVSASVSTGIDGIASRDGYTYIQGAADDEEDWAMGLTPADFWKHHQDLMRCQHEGALLAKVSTIVRQGKAKPAVDAHRRLTHSQLQTNTCPHNSPCTHLYTSTKKQPELCESTASKTMGSDSDITSGCICASGVCENIINIGKTGLSVCDSQNLAAACTPTTKTLQRPATIALRLTESKTDVYAMQRFLRNSAMKFVEHHLSLGERVLITCPTGSGPAVMLALCALCAYFDRDDVLFLSNPRDRRVATKVDVLQILLFINKYHPQAQLARFHLKIVNRHIMSDQSSTT